MGATPQVFSIVLFENFSNHCLANVIEPLRAANTLSDQTLYAWRFLTLDGEPVYSSSRMLVSPHAALGHSSGDVLIVMPSYGFRELEGWSTIGKILAVTKRHAKIAGFDTGSWLLARAGLLDGYRATIHWAEYSQFEETFPDVLARRERYVMDRDRLTCSGGMAAFDVTLAMIAEAHGPLLSIEVSQFLMTQEPINRKTPVLRSQNTVMDRALNVMQDNLEAPLSISIVARKAGCSQRKLETLMKAELGLTPSSLYRRLRLNQARKLVDETDHSVTEIAGRCGYENASAMTRAYKAAFGQTPRDARAKTTAWR